MPNTVVLHDWSNGDAEQDSYPVRLGRGIAAMRELRRLSRKTLASRLGVSSNRLGCWERGVNLPRGKKMVELMLILEVTPAGLLAAGDGTLPPDHEGPEAFERRRTMSSETSSVVEQEPVTVVVTIEPDLKSERVQEEAPAPDLPGTGEEPDLKSERVQDE